MCPNLKGFQNRCHSYLWKKTQGWSLALCCSSQNLTPEWQCAQQGQIHQLSGSQDLPNQSYEGRLVPQSIDFTLQKAACQQWMCVPAHPSTLAFFRDLPALSVLPICTWCFPQLVPNCLVSWIFYCNFLCLIYFKVAKCFHKERTVKLFRNEEDSKTSVSFVSVLGSAW